MRVAVSIIGFVNQMVGNEIDCVIELKLFFYYCTYYSNLSVYQPPSKETGNPQQKTYFQAKFQNNVLKLRGFILCE